MKFNKFETSLNFSPRFSITSCHSEGTSASFPFLFSSFAKYMCNLLGLIWRSHQWSISVTLKNNKIKNTSPQSNLTNVQIWILYFPLPVSSLSLPLFCLRLDLCFPWCCFVNLSVPVSVCLYPPHKDFFSSLCLFEQPRKYHMWRNGGTSIEIFIRVHKESIFPDCICPQLTWIRNITASIPGNKCLNSYPCNFQHLC